MTSIDNTPNYVPVEKARSMPGLRIAFTRGVPGAWSVAIRAILDLKGIEYVAVPQEPGGANEALKAWSGQTSAPVAMFNDDRVRVQWSEMLVLAEQLQPEPRMIPVDEDERMAMFGLCHEICGDDGLGWNVRLLVISAVEAMGSDALGAMHGKYTSPVEEAYARRRILDILGAMSARLERQRAKGNRYFMDHGLSAADIYWAAFSNLFQTMSPDLCTIPSTYKSMPDFVPGFENAVPQILFDHRDYVVRKHFRIPITL